MTGMASITIRNLDDETKNRLRIFVIFLDTNLLSELMKADPAASVVGWTASQPASRLFITAVTQGEILDGIGLLPKGKRRDRIAHAAKAMFAEDFNDRMRRQLMPTSLLPVGATVGRYRNSMPRLQPSRDRAVLQWRHATSVILKAAESSWSIPGSSVLRPASE